MMPGWCSSAALALVGCSSTGSSNVAVSVGQQCTEILGAYCARAFDECGATSTSDAGSGDGSIGSDASAAVDAGDGGNAIVGQCVSDGVLLCCQQSNDCSAGAITPEGAIQACVSDIRAAPCRDLVAEPPSLPATCEQVIRKPQ
jgi:hypothetical protein